MLSFQFDPRHPPRCHSEVLQRDFKHRTAIRRNSDSFPGWLCCCAWPRFASTVHGFSAPTLPILTAKASREQPSMPGVLSCDALLHVCGQVREVRRVPMCHSKGQSVLVCVLTLLKFQSIHTCHSIKVICTIHTHTNDNIK